MTTTEIIEAIEREFGPGRWEPGTGYFPNGRWWQRIRTIGHWWRPTGDATAEPASDSTTSDS